MATFDGVVLGYDLRKSPSSVAYLDWPEEQRKQHFIKPDIKSAVSVDHTVWPSKVHFINSEGCSFKYGDIVGHTSSAFWCHTILLGLHPFIEELRPIRTGEDVLIKIVLHTDIASLTGTLQKNWIAALNETLIPEEPGSSWNFFGYDVADFSFCSALTNCGASDWPEVKNHAINWGQCLNQWGLFDKVEDAERFQALSNRQIKEHQPFLIFGIHELQNP